MGIVSDHQIVSVRTHTGVPVAQWLPDQIVSMKWTRDKRESSICDLVLPPVPGVEDLPIPWAHTVEVWNDTGDERYWSGPIIDVGLDHQSMTIAASDTSAWGSRTRCPVTKRWDAADPGEIAGQLWDAMIELQGLHVAPTVRADPRGGRFAFSSSNSEGDTEMVEDVIARLVESCQLYWTVVAGTPILGPAPLEPVAQLGEHHFVGNPFAFRLVRDGRQTYNDVLVRGADAVVQRRVDAAGMNLQTIRDIHSMFGVSNLHRAAHQLVRYTGAIRDAITMPSGAVLAPDAPVTISELIPSVRFVVEAYGLLSTMELDQVAVTYSQGVSQVAIKLESVNDDLPELLTLRDDPTTGAGVSS